MESLETTRRSQGSLVLDASIPAPRPGTSLQVHWYATYVRSRHEKQVISQLQERNVDCLLPVYRSVRRWKDRRKELELVLFPGYVFVHMDLKDRLRVLQLPSVVRFISFNGHPVPLPDGEIESLSNGLASGIRAEPHPYLKVGHRVQVRSGPMTGAQGILIRRKDKFRIVLSIDLIMRSVAVEVDEADVEPC
ncbi:MAG TPA: UpxY family transcription antiterminator [Terriglobales bacterium]|nr:UpxY family transcription antiterminator [Terriglobales bacterium]